MSGGCLLLIMGNKAVYRVVYESIVVINVCSQEISFFVFRNDSNLEHFPNNPET